MISDFKNKFPDFINLQNNHMVSLVTMFETYIKLLNDTIYESKEHLYMADQIDHDMFVLYNHMENFVSWFKENEKE